MGSTKYETGVSTYKNKTAIRPLGETLAEQYMDLSSETSRVVSWSTHSSSSVDYSSVVVSSQSVDLAACNR